MGTIRIGIIGAGSIVELTHLPAIRTLADTNIAWIYDNNPSRMDKVGLMYNIPTLKDNSIEKAIADVDICLLAIPYGVRNSYIDLCRQNGKALVVEKPFAFSTREHEEHCRDFAKWEIGVNFQRRFYQPVALLQKIIRTSTFGKLESIKLKQGNFVLKGGSGYLSNKKLAGGGVIAESAIHNLDIILFITDAVEVNLKKLRSFHREGLDYDSVFESEISDGQNSIVVNSEITTLRNLGNELQLQFAHALVSWDMSPQGKIKVYNEQLNYSIREEFSYDELNLRATQVNEAFLIYWQQFTNGYRNKTVNATHACRSVLTSSWIESIYNKMIVS